MLDAIGQQTLLGKPIVVSRYLKPGDWILGPQTVYRGQVQPPEPPTVTDTRGQERP